MKKNLLTMLFSGLLLGCASKENAQAESITTEEIRNEQQEAAVDYYPFQTTEGGKWGLINQKGEVLFSEKFDGELSHAVRGRFWAYDEASATYQLYTAEKNPKLVSKKRYKFVTDFFHEVTPVAEEKGKIQFIDINGKVRFTFDQVDGRDVETCGNFIHGVAVFKTEDELYGLVNMKGQVVAAPHYFYISSMDLKTGRAVAVSNDHRHTFMAESEWFNSAQTPIVDILGPEGIVHKDMKLDRCDEYSIDLSDGGLFKVIQRMRGTTAENTGLMDTDGNFVMEPSRSIGEIISVGNNRVIYHKQHPNEQGFWEIGGMAVCDFNGHEIESLSKYSMIAFTDVDGLYYVCDDWQDGFSLANEQGEILSDVMLAGFDDFCKGIAVVCDKDNHSFFLKEDGTKILPPTPIHFIKGSPYYYEEATNDYLNVEEFVEDLCLTDKGFAGIQMTQNAEQVKAYQENINELWGMSVPYSENTDNAFIINRLNKNISMRSVARFEHSTEENGHYSKEHPDMIGFSLSGYGQKTVSHRYELLNAMKDRVKTFGTIVSENKNSLLVDCGNGRLVCVAYDGNNILYLIGPRSELNYSLDDIFPDEPDNDQYLPVEAYILAVG